MRPELIPQPKTIEYGKESLLLVRETEIRIHVCSAGNHGELIKDCIEYAELLNREIKHATGMRLPVCACEDEEALPDIEEEIIRCLEYRKDDSMKEEQYGLQITGDSVILCAGTSAGFLYATQTMRQIIRQCGTVLPKLRIQDEPELPVRGFYHDVTRGRVPTLAYLKQLADTCSFYKINQLQLYVEHSYLFKALGGLFADRDPLTAEEIREFDAYCRKLHIELVPSLSSFGHLYELLRTKQYAHLCELDVDTNEPFSLYDRMAHHTLDVSNPESEALVRKLISEYASLFSSTRFNICADETFDLGKGKNRAVAEKEGTTGLYMDFLVKLCHIVKETGKTPMFWGDVLQEFPKKSALLPEDTVCLYWNYEPQAKEDKLKGLIDSGIANLYVCPGVHGWNHLINRYDHAYDNISKMCEFAHKYHAKGVLVTDWGDYGHVNHPDFSVPGLIYGAAFSWRNEIVPKEEIDRQISAVEYEDASGNFMACVNKLSEGEDITWGQAVCLKEKRVWDQFVPSEDPYRKERLAAAIKEGYRLLHKLTSSSAERLLAYLMAAEGQLLLQEAWHCVADDSKEKKENTEKNTVLSEQLREWYRDYQKLWRSVSKESELFRIGEVIFWYADNV